MKIAVIGSSGHLGHAIASEALSRGHQVTAIARDADRGTGPKCRARCLVCQLIRN